MQKCLQLCMYSIIVILGNKSTCSEEGISITRSKSDMLLPAGSRVTMASGETVVAPSAIRIVTNTERVNFGQQNGQAHSSKPADPQSSDENPRGTLLLEDRSASGQKKRSVFAKIKKLAQDHPRATAAMGTTAAGLMLVHTYKSDKKFRSRVHETSEHYYYKMLEKLLPISFKWADLENQPLMQKDVLLFLGAIGVARLGSSLNTQYQVREKLASLYARSKEQGSSAYAQISDRLGGENAVLFYGVSGLLLATSCRYLYNIFSRQPIYYKELLNRFKHSLDQEQISSIGLEILLQLDNDPAVLEQESVQKFLNQAQKSRVSRIMREYHKYLEKLAQS